VGGLDDDDDDAGALEIECTGSYVGDQLVEPLRLADNVDDYDERIAALALTNARYYVPVVGDGHCGPTALAVQMTECQTTMKGTSAVPAFMRSSIEQAMLEVKNHSSLAPLITPLVLQDNETIPDWPLTKDGRVDLATILFRRARMHAAVDCMSVTMDDVEWCGSLDFKAAALRCERPVYVARPWGAIEIHSHKRDVAVLNMYLSGSMIIPPTALVIFMTTDRNHYEALALIPKPIPQPQE
jgi:hypothetical protein